MDITLDLLIAKYTGRQDGLRAQLRQYPYPDPLTRAVIQALADEVNDVLTDLHRLKAAQEA